MPSTISTGSLKLDQALAIGGIPTGWITEICGPAESGKTTLCQHIISETQKIGGLCALIDGSNLFNPHYAVRCGVEVNDLYICSPLTAEQALETVYILAQSAAFSVIVIDSIDGLASESELERTYGNFGEDGIQRLISNWLPVIGLTLKHSRTALVLTHNQAAGASPIYYALGDNLDRLALSLAAAIRLRLLVNSPMGPAQFVQHIQIQIIKNIFSPCLNSIELDIIVNQGVNKAGELFDLGLSSGVLSRRGQYHYYQSRPLGRNREDSCATLSSQPDLAVEIEQVIRQNLKI
jgi:recombination protein RecA